MSTRRFSIFSRVQICLARPFLLTCTAGSLSTASRYTHTHTHTYSNMFYIVGGDVSACAMSVTTWAAMRFAA